MVEPHSINLLLKQIAADNKDAFNRLFEYLFGKLVSFATHYVRQPETAEDLVSDVFVKLWLKRHSLPVIGAPEAYLYVSVKNECLNYIRQHKQHQGPLLKEKEISAPLSSTNPSGIEGKELFQLLDQAIESLPEQRKIVFRLIKEEGFKSREVAVILNLSVRTVESHLFKAVRTLADALSNHLGYDPRNPRRSQLKNLLVSFF